MSSIVSRQNTLTSNHPNEGSQSVSDDSRPHMILQSSLSTESTCKSCTSSDSCDEIDPGSDRRCACGLIHYDTDDDELERDNNVSADNETLVTVTDSVNNNQEQPNHNPIRGEANKSISCDIFDTNLYLGRIFVCVLNNLDMIISQYLLELKNYESI